MTLYLRPLSSLLLLLLLQACATSQPRKATPYQPPPATQQTEIRNQTVPTPVPPRNPTAQKIQAEATRLKNEGKLEAAAQTLERGLRIAPKDALLWSQLADVRLQQHQYGQAQSMAQKSNTLAGADRALIQRNNTIIEKAQK